MLPLKLAKDNTKFVFNQCGTPLLPSFFPTMDASV